MSLHDLENTIPDAQYVADALWLDKFDAKKRATDATSSAEPIRPNAIESSRS